jgi:hypothetical protein
MDEAKLQEILDDASERLSLGRYSNADAAVHDLVAEVRRLTAALATARREGAEGMRAACDAVIARRAAGWDDDADEHGDEEAETRWEEATAIRNEIRALPLDGDGGAR